MIVKNEEAVIDRCLSSIAGAVDEIVIVDTGSTDQTKSIARRFTEKIVDFEWIDDFAAARNHAFGLATQDYILWLDADDVFTERDYEQFLQLKQSLAPVIDAVSMNYHLAFDGDGNVTYSIRRNRLVRRACGFRWIGAVHEYLEVGGKIMVSDIAVTHRGTAHDSDRNLRIYLKRLASEEFTPRDLYYFANELRDHRMYELAVVYYEKFLASGQGWIEDEIQACGKLADCFQHLGDNRKELEAALRALQYDKPRPELCCRLGYRFLQQHMYDTAIYWYEQALACERKNASWFHNHDCSTWLPHLQLCVCYDKKGDFEKAYQHNEAARAYRPNHSSVLQNKAYLESVLQR
jgi:glycosyltransferase involved in cell wall biosynthesis